jgi:hypothetical protein
VQTVFWGRSLAAWLMPARGHGATDPQKPISEYDRKRGDRIGHHAPSP